MFEQRIEKVKHWFSLQQKKRRLQPGQLLWNDGDITDLTELFKPGELITADEVLGRVSQASVIEIIPRKSLEQIPIFIAMNEIYSSGKQYDEEGNFTHWRIPELLDDSSE